MEFEYVFSDDWSIFAKDETGQMYCVSTELWHEWLDFPKTAAAEPNAVEKYMLPFAKKKWNELKWKKCDT